MPLVAVTSDLKFIDIYDWHATPRVYIDALVNQAGVTPVLVPSFENTSGLDEILQRVDGVLLTGARSNVHPSNYGEEPDKASEPYDRARDATTLPLARKALAMDIPLLAICRGIQELNVALGGTLSSEIQEEEGRDDHRGEEGVPVDDRFRIKHKVHINEGSCLAGILGAGDVPVNSLHRQAIMIPATNLQVEATAPDGTIEAVSVIGARNFALGIQWHPEYWAGSDAPSAKIFEAFGNAVRAHAAGRNNRAMAAE